MIRVLFAPFGIITGLLAGIAARKAFDAIWQLIDDEEPPGPEHRQLSWPKLLAALALQGAAFGIAKGVADHASRVWFSRWVGGTWPGEEEPESAGADASS